MKKTFAVMAVLSIALLATGCSKKTAKTIATVDDLKDAKIGVQIGTTGFTLASSDYGKDNVECFDKGLQAVQALKQGKIDAVIIDDQPAQVFASENDDIKILDEEYTMEDYAIAVGKDNTELKDKINAALEQLKSDGTMDNLIGYYLTKKDGCTAYEKKDVDRANGTLVMATNAEFPPYEYKEGDAVVGFDADMAQAICDILGMELQIDDMNFDSVITSVVSGKADVGIAGLSVTEERLQTVDFSESYYSGRQVVIVKK